MFDYNAAIDAGKTHTFIFTHGPIVGHGGGATHGLFYDNDLPFVEWVNEEGMTVEAVFGGHTHEDHIFRDVQEADIDDPWDYYYDGNYSPSDIVPLYFSQNTFYIETDTATKRW